MENKRFTDFYEAYTFLENHQMIKSYTEYNGDLKGFEINNFRECLDIEVVKVNPETSTLEIEEDKLHLNTKTEIWLEFGSWNEEVNSSCHDYDLDCGGDSFEEAIINLANLVDEFYDENTGEKIKSSY